MNFSVIFDYLKLVLIYFIIKKKTVSAEKLRFDSTKEVLPIREVLICVFVIREEIMNT